MYAALMARKIRLDTTLSPEVLNILKESAPNKQNGGMGAYIESAILDKALSEGDLRALELKERYLNAKKEALSSEIEALNALMVEVEAQLRDIEARRLSALKIQQSKQAFISEIKGWINEYEPSVYLTHPNKRRIDKGGKSDLPDWLYRYLEYDEGDVMAASMADFMQRYKGRIITLKRKANRSLIQITDEDIKALYEDLKRSEIALMVNKANKAELERMERAIMKYESRAGAVD